MCVYVLHSWFLECIFHHAFVFWGHATFIFWIMSDCLELHWGIAIALISFQHATVRCATKTPWSPFIPQFINHLAQIKWNQSGAFLRWNHRSRTRDKCTACFFSTKMTELRVKTNKHHCGNGAGLYEEFWEEEILLFYPPFFLSMITACPSICSRPVGNILSLWGFLGRGKELMSLPHKDSEDKETGPPDSYTTPIILKFVIYCYAFFNCIVRGETWTPAACYSIC